ncbi:hypothetical protein [Novipirellula artificiosorum]|nr:hypothetical protein [Novipirellula artificiosorum]
MNDWNALRDAIRVAKSLWTGCHWTTQFGSLGIDLSGLRSRQAMLAAKATRGAESHCWSEAAKWLASVEQDASLAAGLADLALRAARGDDLLAANRYLGEAIALEEKYRSSIAYASVRKVFEQGNSLEPLTR